MTAIIEIEGLRKDYRRRHEKPFRAVDGLDLSVPEGGVFGFLGPNGSGKTTTIRCLVGLVSATSGTTSLLGQPTPAELATVMPRVGTIVETPAMFPTMTARNLQLLGGGWHRATASLRGLSEGGFGRRMATTGVRAALRYAPTSRPGGSVKDPLYSSWMSRPTV
jgi:ABC-type Fe3+/spermidine/putrescine transport system ATPase subunit